MYRYQYTFRLSPARQKSGICFTEHQALIEEAIDAINGGLSFSRGQKTLVLLTIDDREMTVTLTSQEPLVNPSRSLRALTRYLTSTYPKIFEPYIYNKTLFNIYAISQEATPTSQADFRLSNEEIMKEIIDLLYTYPGTRDVKEAKAQITEILRPFVEKKSNFI